MKRGVVADDAFISLRYSQRLLDGQGLTWTAGERVEGYSNLLWVLACAGLGALGVDLLVATKILSSAGMGVAFMSLAWMFRPVKMRNNPMPGALALLLFAECRPLIIWTVCGLEAPFVIGFLAMALAFMTAWLDTGRNRILIMASAPLTLLVLTRPDGPLFVVVIAGIAGITTRKSTVKHILLKIMSVSLLPLVAYLGQLTFRIVYYSELVPNTALVKLPTGLYRFHEGIRYVVLGLRYQWPIWIVALLSLVVIMDRMDDTRKKRVHMLWLMVCTWTVYIMYAGGDHLQGERFLVPTLFLLCALSAEGAGYFWELVSRKSKLMLVALVLSGIGLVGWFSIIQWQDREILECYHAKFRPVFRGRFFAWFFRQAFDQEHLYIAIDAAGSVPYYMPGDEFLDMLGLTDPNLAKNASDQAKKGMLAHSLGDADYFLARQPDVFLFGPMFGCYGGVYLSQKEMVASTQFLQRYTFYEFLWTDHPRVRLWVRNDISVRVEDPGDVVSGLE